MDTPNESLEPEAFSAAPTGQLPAPAPPGTLPDFTPVPRERMRKNGWSADRQRAFIEALAETGSVRAACRKLGAGQHTIYKLRRHPEAESFRKAWEAALDIGITRIEDAAMDRALNGVEEDVFYKGEVVGTRRHFNDNLLMFLLRNRSPKRFAADRAKGMSAIDAHMLASLKKEWRAEWDREAAAREYEDEDAILESINNRLDSIKESQGKWNHLQLGDGREEKTRD